MHRSLSRHYLAIINKSASEYILIADREFCRRRFLNFIIQAREPFNDYANSLAISSLDRRSILDAPRKRKIEKEAHRSASRRGERKRKGTTSVDFACARCIQSVNGCKSAYLMSGIFKEAERWMEHAGGTGQYGDICIWYIIQSPLLLPLPLPLASVSRRIRALIRDEK